MKRFRRDGDTVTELALAAAAGDERALTAFIKATQADVWRFIRFLSDERHADDLTQETYLRAHQSLARFEGRSSATTWLLTIARRTVADHVRYEMSRPRREVWATDETLVALPAAGARHEGGVELRMLLDELPDDRREALVLTQILGLSYAEAAAVADCPVGTIRSRVARARDDLQSAYRPDGRTRAV
ncbi:MAG: sigma-70 family RNA polymerase sigma factor [Gordonia sp. (in: high G+C Gram-positive bacteria)]|uniref:sigma-70 family RNA polymerase sigma factor n=1 Tax=Gordonia sp. (in: high G+C Gram-positive bacteria) TaxID=84139 RepID=UPI0039E5F40F